MLALRLLLGQPWRPARFQPLKSTLGYLKETASLRGRPLLLLMAYTANQLAIEADPDISLYTVSMLFSLKELLGIRKGLILKAQHSSYVHLKYSHSSPETPPNNQPPPLPVKKDEVPPLHHRHPRALRSPLH